MSVLSPFFSVVGAGLGFAFGGLPGAALGLGLGSSIGGSIDSASAVDRANQINIEQAREAREWQSAENFKAREYASHEAYQAWARQMQSQYHLEEFYSPSNQAQMLRDAGFNPAVSLAAGLTQSSGGVPSSSVPSAPMSGSPSVAQVQPVQYTAGVQDGILKYAQAYGQVAKAGLDKANEKKVLTMLDSELAGQELANEYQKIYAPMLAKAQTKHYVESAAMYIQQALTLADQGDLYKAQQKYYDALEESEKMLTELRGEQAENLRLKNETFYTDFESELERRASESEKNRASASLSYAERKRILDSLPNELELQKLEIKAKELDNKLKVSELINSAYGRRKLAAELVNLTFENKWNSELDRFKKDIIFVTSQSLQEQYRYQRNYNYNYETMPMLLRWFQGALPSIISTVGKAALK